MGDFATTGSSAAIGRGALPGLEQQHSGALLGARIVGELAVDVQSLRQFVMLFIQRGQLQQIAVIGMIEVRGFSIVRFRFIAAALPREGLSQSQFGSGRSRVHLHGLFERRGGLGELIGREQRVAQIVDRPELLGLLLRGRLQERNRRRGILRVEQRHRKVELRFIQSGMQFQSLPVLGDGLRILARHAVGQRQVEVRAVIGGIGGNGLGERLPPPRRIFRRPAP